jgi:thiamine pyrophosphokinase
MIDLLPAFEAVVLAAGDYPRHALPLRVLREARYLVCCDGAANEYWQQSGRMPDAIVGDGDSGSRRFVGLTAETLVVLLAEQDTNDLTKSIRFLQERGVRTVAILGAAGKREDHTLGNISLLIEYLHAGMTVRMITDNGIFIPARGRQTFPCHAGQQVSVFAMSARRKIRYQGLRYPAPTRLINWWQGTLNECMEEEFVIETTGDYLVWLQIPALVVGTNVSQDPALNAS